MNPIHSYHVNSEQGSIRFHIVRLFIYASVTFLYFYGLLYSDGALYITVPNTSLTLDHVSSSSSSSSPVSNDSGSSGSNSKEGSKHVKFLRSLPHLRVINTLDLHQRHGAKMDHTEEGGTTKSSNETNVDDKKDISTMNFSLWKPFYILLSFILACRLFLAILIYRNLSQAVELDFSEMGQIRQRRVQVANSLRPSFWEIFRSLPIRTRGTSSNANNFRSGNNYTSRRARVQQARFLMLANRLNEQRVANGARPMSIQSLALLFSDRDFSGTDYDSLWEVQEQNGPALEELWRQVGASDEEINRCPTRTLEEGDELINTTNEINHEGGNGQMRSSDLDLISVERTKCAICLEDFKAGHTIRTLPCFHSFHMDCIDRWLKQKSICPICKHNAVA